MERKKRHIVWVVWVNLCRFLLGAVFIFSGFVKAIDLYGFTYKLEDYLSAFGWSAWVPSFLPGVSALLLSATEFCIGTYLLFGIRRKIASFMALLLMIVMTPLTFYIALTNPVGDCGCFGDAWVLTNWETFGKNIVLLIAAFTTFKWRTHIYRFLTLKVDWLLSSYTVFFILTLSIYCSLYLPILDFRPYRIGTNIPAGMEVPEGAKPPVFETRFVLEKQGVKQEFTLENYPDSTWTFVESRTVLIEEGYEPPIHDFALTSVDTGEEVTEQVLGDKGYTFLLLAKTIETADQGYIDLINELYDYSVEHGYAFYAVTASGEDQIEEWCDQTGAEYPFLQMDEITLKTMIRSNPGLMLLKEGTILNKWSNIEIPDEYQLHDRLENLPMGMQKPVNDWKTMGYVMLWFFLPLLLIGGMDVLVLRRREKKRN